MGDRVAANCLPSHPVVPLLRGHGKHAPTVNKNCGETIASTEQRSS